MDKNRTTRNRIAGLVALACWLLLICGYSYNRPACNFDMVPYMTLTLVRDGYSITDAQQLVKKTITREIDPQKSSLLTDPANHYRSGMLNDPATLRDNLPLYAVKPLYTGTVYLFYKTGFTLTKATVLPSLLAYFFTCLLIFTWLLRFRPPVVALALTMLVSLWAPVINTSQLATPDMLCALLILSAVFFLTQRRAHLIMYVCCVLAVTARIDCLLPVTFLVFLSQMKRFNNGGTSLLRLSLMISGLVVCYFLVSIQARSFGWDINFYGELIRHLNTGYRSNESFSIHAYIDLVKSQAMTGLYYSDIVLYFILSALLLRVKRPFSLAQLSQGQLALLGFGAVMVVRFILQPVIADRFYIAYYVFALIMGVQSWNRETEIAGDPGELEKKQTQPGS